MRQIVLDTETTGLEPSQGHRVIELGCVELVDRRLTGEKYHQYLCPGREVDLGAVEIHGLTNEFLADKPQFGDIVTDFLKFIEGAELIIHNAPFDVGFLNNELGFIGSQLGVLEDYCWVTDTLVLARELHPGQRNSLDALCKRYGVDNSHRDLHGALLDAQILADVYLAMTGGQVSLSLQMQTREPLAAEADMARSDAHRPRLKVIRASGAELDAHHRQLEEIDKASGGNCLWKKMES